MQLSLIAFSAIISLQSLINSIFFNLFFRRNAFDFLKLVWSFNYHPVFWTINRDFFTTIRTVWLIQRSEFSFTPLGGAYETAGNLGDKKKAVVHSPYVLQGIMGGSYLVRLLLVVDHK